MTIEKRQAATGEKDRRAFEELFKSYFVPLISFSKRILLSEDDAREVVHQVFINLWEKWNETDHTTSLKSYLFTSVRNRSLNVIRDRKKFTSEEVPEQTGEWDVSALLEAMELEEKIRGAIAVLPGKCREIFELNRFDGLRYNEIANRLGISVKTVENQMSKALKILRDQLAKYLTILLWLMLFTMN